MTLEKLKEMNKDIMNSIMDEACDPTEVKKRTEKPEFDEFCTKLAYTRHTHLKKEQIKVPGRSALDKNWSYFTN